MILVDTSVWIDHLRAGDGPGARLLERGAVLAHPWVIGELALGHLRQRQEVVALLDHLPQATTATPHEVLTLIEHHALYGIGIGYVDAQLLTAAKLTDGAALWSNDRRLGVATSRLGCAFDPNMRDVSHHTHRLPSADDGAASRAKQNAAHARPGPDAVASADGGARPGPPLTRRTVEPSLEARCSESPRPVASARTGLGS